MSKKPKFNQIISVIGDIHDHSLLSPDNHRCVKRQKKVTFDNYALYLQFRSTDCPSEVNIILQKHNLQRSISISS